MFVLIKDEGDGSYSPRFTFNTSLINKLSFAAEGNWMDSQNGVGVDGDGFHYTTITVPDDATYESLGILRPLPDDFADKFFKED